MPELPEVEVVVQGLRPHLLHQQFCDIEIRKAKMTNFTRSDFLAVVKEQKITKVERIGKMVVIHLEKNILIFHLKMTGQVVFDGVFMGGHTMDPVQESLENKHTHIIFTLKNRAKILFNDQRTFGYCHLISPEDLSEYTKTYGLEPIHEAFLFEDVWKIVQAHPKMKFKAFLLTQKFIAGIGNIYADEIAFKSRIHPETRVGSISEDKWREIHKNIPEVLQLSIDFNGTTFSSFLAADGSSGNFMEYLKVYGRGGEKCESCPEILEKMKVAGRGTVFCPKCQKFEV